MHRIAVVELIRQYLRRQFRWYNAWTYESGNQYFTYKALSNLRHTG
jgi:hypothetical protein